jgi:hypothetical protein
MALALKAFTRGTLTFFEIAIVVFFIASLAAMAALGVLEYANGTVHPKFQACFLIS